MSKKVSGASKSYSAFISYSHAADNAFAPALQNGLQRLAKPWHKARALEVFRDQTGLSVDPKLWTSITRALDGAEWFVLLASPESATSEWVGKEIQHWVATKGADRILPVLTGGTWVWDSARNDFDWTRSTAVHPELGGVFTEEPRHVDMSWAHAEAELSLRGPQFREQVAEIAAPMPRPWRRRPRRRRPTASTSESSSPPKPGPSRRPRRPEPPSSPRW